MKTGTKISLISSLSALVLVGTAFAAWQFNKSATKDVASNVAITKDTSVGEITLNPETFYLTLDQDFLGFTSANHTDDSEAVTDGLTTVQFTYTGSDKANDVSDVTLEVTFNVDSALATYVTVSGGSLGTPTANANEKVADYTLPTVTWVNNKKPTKQADFDAMKTAIASAKVTFTFKATVA